jgi:hypothetical protein
MNCERPIKNEKILCTKYVGILNEPHYKCEICGREEWEHKLIYNTNFVLIKNNKN